jgi:MarR family transcriptional regulator, 2-MHQ and catechol-resistance regulon repressor
VATFAPAMSVRQAHHGSAVPLSGLGHFPSPTCTVPIRRRSAAKMCLSAFPPNLRLTAGPLLIGFPTIVIQTVSGIAMRTLAVAVVRAGSVLQREAGRLFRPFGVSAAHFNVINLLAVNPKGLRASEITQSLVVDPSSTTYTLDQLEERGWAARQRDPDDRRALKIVLTPAGKNLHARILPAYHAALQRMTASFDSAELSGALPFLEKLPATAVEAVDTVIAENERPRSIKRAKMRRAR